jgi:DNA-binding MarR family transcriptional regulator
MDTFDLEHIREIIREEVASASSHVSGSQLFLQTPFEDKWGPDISDLGFVQVPKALLLSDLTPNEKTLISILLTFGDLVFPGNRTLSQAMHISTRQISEHLHNLEAKGWITRKNINRNGVHRRYINLTPVKKKLQDLIQNPTCKNVPFAVKENIFPFSNSSSRKRTREIKKTWELINKAAPDFQRRWRQDAANCNRQTGPERPCQVTAPPIPPKCLLCAKYKKRLISFLWQDPDIEFASEFSRR